MIVILITCDSVCRLNYLLHYFPVCPFAMLLCIKFRRKGHALFINLVPLSIHTCSPLYMMPTCYHICTHKYVYNFFMVKLQSYGQYRLWIVLILWLFLFTKILTSCIVFLNVVCFHLELYVAWSFNYECCTDHFTCQTSFACFGNRILKFNIQMQYPDISRI